MKRIYYAITLVTLTCLFHSSCSRSGERPISNKPTNERVETSNTKAQSPKATISPVLIEEPVLLRPESQQEATSQLPPQKSKCDPNYSGCVPIANDVDCFDGEGDGPEYVDGPIEVIGYDKYELDRDGNGIACE